MFDKTTEDDTVALVENRPPIPRQRGETFVANQSRQLVQQPVIVGLVFEEFFQPALQTQLRFDQSRRILVAEERRHSLLLSSPERMVKRVDEESLGVSPDERDARSRSRWTVRNAG